MEFYGVLGEKLPHSISPEIHEKIFKLLNINGAYKIFEVEKSDINKACDSLRILKIKGTNVTIPYKQEIMQYLDSISEEAEKIGAVNTIYLKDGRLSGYNTDYFGFGTIIDKNNVSVKDETAVVLGTGGASKAVVTYLLDKDIKKLYIVSRIKKDETDHDDIRVEYITYKEIEHIKGNILVNTTPVGMYPKTNVSPVNEEVINNFDTLIDIIYNPRMTEFLELGHKLGKKVCGGLEMLVGQAIKAEEIWQEININDEILDEVYEYINKQFNFHSRGLNPPALDGISF
ncbi:MAG: shikimate dehydrogenase [Clostridium butyricum]|nr:shikimate dehydrogenase [Clostridium butyricum]MDU5820596.1 shikimate dehydrogenase [Clostridium butyricum]